MDVELMNKQTGTRYVLTVGTSEPSLFALEPHCATPHVLMDQEYQQVYTAVKNDRTYLSPWNLSRETLLRDIAVARDAYYGD